MLNEYEQEDNIKKLVISKALLQGDKFKRASLGKNNLDIIDRYNNLERLPAEKINSFAIAFPKPPPPTRQIMVEN